MNVSRPLQEEIPLVIIQDFMYSSILAARDPDKLQCLRTTTDAGRPSWCTGLACPIKTDRCSARHIPKGQAGAGGMKCSTKTSCQSGFLSRRPQPCFGSRPCVPQPQSSSSQAWCLNMPIDQMCPDHQTYRVHPGHHRPPPRGVRRAHGRHRHRPRRRYPADHRYGMPERAR